MRAELICHHNKPLSPDTRPTFILQRARGIGKNNKISPFDKEPPVYDELVPSSNVFQLNYSTPLPRDYYNPFKEREFVCVNMTLFELNL